MLVITHAAQIDDDLYIQEPFKLNMVSEMADKVYKVANHRWVCPNI